MGIFDERVWHPTSAHPNPFGGKPSEFLDFCTKAAGACPEFCLAETVPISFGFALKMVCGRYIVAKERVDAHLSEDVSEAVVKKHLPSEWVMRKLHPDYGVDVSIEVFERVSTKIPTMGEFLFVQLKSTSNLLESVLKIRERGNVEKAIDAEQGQYFLNWIL